MVALVSGPNPWSTKGFWTRQPEKRPSCTCICWPETDQKAKRWRSCSSENVQTRWHPQETAWFFSGGFSIKQINPALHGKILLHVSKPFLPLCTLQCVTWRYLKSEQNQIRNFFRYFFRFQIFTIPNPILFRYRIQNHSKKKKVLKPRSFETKTSHSGSVSRYVLVSNGQNQQSVVPFLSYLLVLICSSSIIGQCKNTTQSLMNDNKYLQAPKASSRQDSGFPVFSTIGGQSPSTFASSMIQNIGSKWESCWFFQNGYVTQSKSVQAGCFG